MNQVILITAGQGPVECQWVVDQVFAKFKSALVKNEIGFQELGRVEGEINGTLKSVLLSIEAHAELNVLLESWLGTILWVGNSPYRRNHKRKNWFISLRAIDCPIVSLVEAYDKKDFRVDVMRSSGPGGQHVNKRQSAVRITHTTTGISTISSGSRSQHQNKKRALDQMNQKLEKLKGQKLDKQKVEQFLLHYKVERGNPVRVFRGANFL